MCRCSLRAAMGNRDRRQQRGRAPRQRWRDEDTSADAHLETLVDRRVVSIGGKSLLAGETRKAQGNSTCWLSATLNTRDWIFWELLRDDLLFIKSMPAPGFGSDRSDLSLVTWHLADCCSSESRAWSATCPEGERSDFYSSYQHLFYDYGGCPKGPSCTVGEAQRGKAPADKLINLSSLGLSNTSTHTHLLAPP